ncbi:MAG: hypothetical protein ACI4Q6_03395 [Huintestinicola sp.]
MANSIALFKKYIDLLDEVYKQAATTSVLDIDGALVSAGANANEIVIPKMTMDGLADYSRNGGYVTGNVNFTHQTVAFNYDRGRKFNVDAMDNAETAGLAFGKLASEFVRTKAVPEMDAVRFAEYASASGIGDVSETLNAADNIFSSIRTAMTAMDEAEVPADGRYLFITPHLYNIAMGVEKYKSTDILDSLAGIIKVPQSRFYTAVELLDGTSSEEEIGGYKKAEGAKDINFMIIHKPAVIQFGKHTVSKVFGPEQNPDADAYIFTYRAYGLTDTYENKAAGIYCSHKA